MLDNATTAAQSTNNDTLENGGGVSAMHFDHVKNTLRREYGETSFRSWIMPLEFSSWHGNVLTLAAPTRFVRDWVKTHYADMIAKTWAKQAGATLRVEWVVGTNKEAVATAFEPAAIANDTPLTRKDAGVTASVTDITSALDPKFTFDTFITATSNDVAFGAAKKVAEHIISGAKVLPFNPLFLQGGVGLGKTHLMQAAAQMIRTEAPARKVIYMSAEKFMYQFVRALRAKDTMTFKEQFRNIDILMIDDIQFICGKESTQEEFLHTFNALIDQGKQIILSADKAPGDLDGLDERLRSRLGMGLVAGIGAPSYDLRLSILQSKCALMGRQLSADVLEFIARKITASIREMEGALNRLIAHAELAGRDVTVESATDILQDLLRVSDRRIAIEDIQKKVAEYYGIRTSDILSPRRARPVARPRQIAMYLSKVMTEHSLPEIGRKFGGRDHTTIIHGVRKIEELMQADRTIAADVDVLKRAIVG